MKNNDWKEGALRTKDITADIYDYLTVGETYLFRMEYQNEEYIDPWESNLRKLIGLKPKIRVQENLNLFAKRITKDNTPRIREILGI